MRSSGAVADLVTIPDIAPATTLCMAGGTIGVRARSLLILGLTDGERLLLWVFGSFLPLALAARGVWVGVKLLCAHSVPVF